jgi:phosphatidate cytidylyltransferase
MFRQRVLSALVGIPVVLAVTWQGDLPFFLFALFLGILALRELYNMCGVRDSKERVLGYVAHTVLFLLAYLYGTQALLIGLIFVFLAVNILWVLAFPRDFKTLSVLIWGKLYITVMLSCFLWLRQAPDGFLLVAAVFVTVWASDTGAYLVGITLGKHRLIPAVSPKKSVEGAVGGLISAAIAMALMGPMLGFGQLQAATMGVLLSIMGQVGDLAESALKRSAETKDSGNFLPGHGGVLDRLDSLLFVAPLAWILFVILT